MRQNAAGTEESTEESTGKPPINTCEGAASPGAVSGAAGIEVTASQHDSPAAREGVDEAK
jgi:hypothetical protein